MAAEVLLRPDMDEAISPRQPAPPSLERGIRPVGPVNNPLNVLDLRADPDAQATVSDFLDFTEYLPADIARSLTLVGDLDHAYVDESAKLHDLTAAWGTRQDYKRGAAELRVELADDVLHLVNQRAFALAESQRMIENVNRHHVRAKTIRAKLETMRENYPAPEEQKSPVTAKSPQMLRAAKATVRGDGQKVRRPRVPRITVPGEVLAPYDLTYDAYTTGTDSSSGEEQADEEGLGRSNRPTPAPPTRIKVVKSRTPKPGRPPRPRSSVPPPGLSETGLSTSAVMAQLAPPPENAVIGGPDAPWGQLTAYELARLRKRMKKNAAWAPSDTMVARELNALGRGMDAFRAAKKKAEEEGRPFEGTMPTPSVDPDTGERRMPPGALTLETSDEKNLSNRGMKLNEAKKLKREMLAKMAAEEAEESARRFDAIARTLMSDANQDNVQDQSKAAGKAKAQRKRKRDSAPEAEAEKLETAEGQAQRPQLKRTKTETPVPPPVLTPGGSQMPLDSPAQPLPRNSAAGMLHSTTPIPLPMHGQEQSIAAKSTTPAASAASAASPASSYAGPTGCTKPPVKLPATETPILPPVISPKKSITPILPPPRETRKTQAARQEQQQLEARAAQAFPTHSRSASPSTAAKPDPDATPTTAIVTRRPASRGKTVSQEPQASLAADRHRRASTARNTPAPEQFVSHTITSSSSSSNTPTAAAAAAAGRSSAGKRAKRPVPGVVSRTNSGGNSAVGKRKAAPRKKTSSAAAAAAAARRSKAATAAVAADAAEMATTTTMQEVEVDDEGNVIDPHEARYCLCNRVSFGTMIQCDNVDNCKQEWFHLECVGLSDIPARTTKWYCPDCRKLLNIGEKGEVSARGIRA
ncbi:hypothetical protein N658DRAFT_415937 [Parathielavia hyrcaniae]|uniref:PHD-type domain-containing protein n=1 Tax=Parathielavia hyrcaniae TaxID=113614 RepID=A0AAN6QGN7_9PEZI|nr:hypothetical protein N658DRAFT_415937 [Parathielavia hyrcaniae]